MAGKITLYDNETITSKYRHAFFEVKSPLSYSTYSHHSKIMQTIAECMENNWIIIHVSDISNHESIIHAYKLLEEEKPKIEEDNNIQF